MPSKFKVLKSLMSRWLSMGKKEEILPFPLPSSCTKEKYLAILLIDLDSLTEESKPMHFVKVLRESQFLFN